MSCASSNSPWEIFQSILERNRRGQTIEDKPFGSSLTDLPIAPPHLRTVRGQSSEELWANFFEFNFFTFEPKALMSDWNETLHGIDMKCVQWWFHSMIQVAGSRRTEASVAETRRTEARLTAMLTDQNSSEIEKRSFQLYPSRTTVKAETRNTDLFFKYWAMKGHERGVLFLRSKKCGQGPPFWDRRAMCVWKHCPRHFTSQQLQTQHCSKFWVTH